MTPRQARNLFSEMEEKIAPYTFELPPTPEASKATGHYPSHEELQKYWSLVQIALAEWVDLLTLELQK